MYLCSNDLNSIVRATYTYPIQVQILFLNLICINKPLTWVLFHGGKYIGVGVITPT